jgi:hypothetical protein
LAKLEGKKTNEQEKSDQNISPIKIIAAIDPLRATRTS